MNYNIESDIMIKRNYKVVKANEIIQKARYELSIMELKSIAFLFSMIKPNDKKFEEYTFSIKDYCMVCGIDYKNGGNYNYIKQTLKGLRDKSFWLVSEDGTEETIGWLYKVYINKGSGKVRVIFDESLQKYVTGLFENYTQYELLCTLPMRSSYSFRIYEILKSYAYQKKHTFSVDELKRMLSAEHYVNFKDFRKKVIEVAIREINTYSDLEITWEPITKGKKVIQIHFNIKQLDTWSRFVNSRRANEQIDGQLNLRDFMS